METRPHVSLSAAQLSSLSSDGCSHDQGHSSGFIPIKAPLSLDSDFDIHVRNDDHEKISATATNSSSEAGEDEVGFETASERPFVGFVDEENSLGSDDDFEEYVIANTFLAVPDDEEALEIPVEYSTPTARLSMDDDSEEELSEVEDSGFLGPGRISGVRVLEKIDEDVPRFRVLAVEEDEFQPRIKVNYDVFDGAGNEVLGSGKAESLVEQSVGGLVEDRDFDNTQVAIAGAPSVNREDIVEETLKLNEDVRSPSRGVSDLRSSEFDNKDAVHLKLEAQRGSPVHVNEPTEVIEESLIMVDSADVIEEHSDFKSVDESLWNSTGKKEIESVSQAKNSKLNPTQGTKHLRNGNFLEAAEDVKFEDRVYGKSSSSVSRIQSSSLDTGFEVNDEANNVEGEGEGPVSDEDAGSLVFGSSDVAKWIVNDKEQSLVPNTGSGADIPQHHLRTTNGQIPVDSDDKLKEDGGDEEQQIFDSEALTSLLEATTGDGGDVIFTSADSSRLFSLKHPSGLESSVRSASQSTGLNICVPSNLTAEVEPKNSMSVEEKEKVERTQFLGIRFLRLVKRLGHSPEDSIVAQVLYQLGVAAGKHSNAAFSLESVKGMTRKLGAEDKGNIDFSLNILVLGKTGVGKSATINSIFREEKAMTSAFEPATSAVNEIIGTIDGVKIRILDTPGLKSALMEQAFNQKVLCSIKKFMKKFPPDVVLYVDRLDTKVKDVNDLPLLNLISSSLGTSIWKNAIITLTHGASCPPDGPSGSPLSYDLFVSQQSHSVQLCIRQTVGDLNLMNPISIVENHPLCSKNVNGHKVLPNGLEWRTQLLLLCCSMKTLSEASSMLKPQGPSGQRELFGFRVCSPLPLLYLLPSLLQSFTHPNLSADIGSENFDSATELGNVTDAFQEDYNEYDQTPSLKPLGRSDIAELRKEQRKAYFDEYYYRVKLLEEKVWRQEMKRLRKMRKGSAGGNDNIHVGEDGEQEYGNTARASVPLRDMMVLPPSFDADNPAYRYRSLDVMSQLPARPVLIRHCWDHDCGYEGVSLEKSLAIAGMFPAEVTVQVTKGKKEFDIDLDSSVSVKHGENGSTLAGLKIETIGKLVAYTVRGEAEMKNFKTNKTNAGVSVTVSGKNVATGIKIEDQIEIGRHLTFVGSAGAVQSQNDAAYGANFKVCLKENDFHVGQEQATLGLSLMKWRNNFALMANLRCHFSIKQRSKMAFHVALNNKLSGKVIVKTSGLEQLQIALMGVPIAMAIFRSLCPKSGQGASVC